MTNKVSLVAKQDKLLLLWNSRNLNIPKCMYYLLG